MLPDELQRALRADAFDGFEVVASQEDAQVDELRHVHFETLQRPFEVNLGNGRLARLGEGEVAVEDGRAERERVHVLRPRCVDFATARELSALRFSFGRCLGKNEDSMRWRTMEWGGKEGRETYDDEGDAHEAEEFPTLFVMLARYLDRAPGEAVHVFRGTCKRGLVVCCGRDRGGVSLPVSLASSPSSLASSLLSKRLESCTNVKGG